MSALTLGAVATLSPTDSALANRHTQGDDDAAQRLALDLPELTDSVGAMEAVDTAQVQPTSTETWQTVTIAKGDTLSQVFGDLGLTHQTLQQVIDTNRKGGKVMPVLKQGQQLHFDIRDSELHALRFAVDPLTTGTFVRSQGEGFSVVSETKHVDNRLTQARGEISSSLYQTGQAAGLTDKTIMALADIFGWDIDFALDIREGDRFALIYEQRFVEGEKVDDGDILAAEFVNQGQLYRAIRFTDAEGNSDYYSPDGRSMRKAFLRSPVDFRRISSKFAKERYHPVLGVKRPHKGVDYAASSGTPIKAAGNGKVIFAGTKGGYGRTVVIQHGNNITTLYGHMSRYQGGIKTGSRVQQGQVIGYVGQSGVATGPHLHYEFRVNDVHRNPLTVKLPDAQPIATAHKEEFGRQVELMTAQLDLARQQTQVALVQSR